MHHETFQHRTYLKYVKSRYVDREESNSDDRQEQTKIIEIFAFSEIAYRSGRWFGGALFLRTDVKTA